MFQILDMFHMTDPPMFQILDMFHMTESPSMFQLLDMFHMTDSPCNRGYLMDTQDPLLGGFAKWPDNTPGLNQSLSSHLSLILHHGIVLSCKHISFFIKSA